MKILEIIDEAKRRDTVAITCRTLDSGSFHRHWRQVTAFPRATLYITRAWCERNDPAYARERKSE